MSNGASYMSLGYGSEIDTQEKLNEQRSALVNNGNYPIDMSDCYVVGITGDCGKQCPVFKRGECEYQKELKS